MKSDTGLVYTIGIDDANGNRIDTIDTKDSSYVRSFDTPGNYSCYITTYNIYGLADSDRVYFTIYNKKPQWAEVELSQNLYYLNEPVTFSFKSDLGLNYTLGIDEETETRTRIDTKDTYESSYSRTFDKAGNYSCYITTYNQYGLADSERVYFTIYDKKPSWAKVTLPKDEYIVN